MARRITRSCVLMTKTPRRWKARVGKSEWRSTRLNQPGSAALFDRFALLEWESSSLIDDEKPSRDLIAARAPRRNGEDRQFCHQAKPVIDPGHVCGTFMKY